jgi:REP element-mobilizing transposase RayT
MRKIEFIEERYYHIYNRGNSKQVIFKDEADYDRFIKLLYICNSTNDFTFRDSVIDQKIDAYDFDRGEPLIDICAWVLMPNHFHLLIHLPRGQASGKEISKFMIKLGTAYVMYFNEKYRRTGSLFEGPFKAKLVAEDSYLQYLFAYINLNPVKLIQSDWKERGIINKKLAFEYLLNYQYSSLIDWLGKENRLEEKIINKDALIDIVNQNIDLKRELFEWINYEI